MADPEDDGPTRPALVVADLEAMTPQERRAVMFMLARMSNVSRPPALVARRRRLSLVIAASVVLVPWTTYLGLTLPDRYVVHNWELTWTGFDAILTLMFAATAVLAMLRRQLVVLAAFTAGVLLLCDAWFDLTTANSGDLLTAIITAGVFEVPIAVLLISSSLRLLKLTLQVLLLGEDARLWEVPLLLPEADAR